MVLNWWHHTNTFSPTSFSSVQSLGIILFLRSLYYEGEGIGFRLFRATGYIQSSVKDISNSATSYHTIVRSLQQLPPA